MATINPDSIQISENPSKPGFSKDSRYGLIAIMLGMTICFSTLWRFPYQVASFGGMAFVIIYIVMLIFFVYPALTAEWGLGRFTNSGPEEAYDKLHLPKAVSYLLFFIVFAIGSYFIVWVGWIIEYAFKSLTDPALVQNGISSTSYFSSNVVNQPLMQLLFAGIVLLLIAPVLLKGSKSIERISSIVVPIFFCFIVGITLFIFIQPGILPSMVAFLSSFNMSQITPYTFVAALGQAFFSLCLGGTYMVLYSSYMKKSSKHDIPVNAGLTIIGNTLASLLSMFLVFGIIIYSSLGLSTFSSFGPGLLFSAIPEAFQSLPLPVFFRQILLFLFFSMFFLSAFLPMVAILEVLVVFVSKKLKIGRMKAFISLFLLLLVAAIPSVLSPLEGGFLYNLDIFVGAIGSVIGSIIAIYSFSWLITKKEVLKIVNLNSKIRLGNTWYFFTKYVSPFVMILVIAYALADTITGYFSLDKIPTTSYILYSVISFSIPLLVILVGILIFVSYYHDRKDVQKYKL